MNIDELARQIADVKAKVDDLCKTEVKYIRWLIRRDLAAVLIMEMQESGSWTDSDWVTAICQRNIIGMVAEDQHSRIVGAMLYELNKGHLNIIRLLVDDRFRRQGVATEMLIRLRDKLSQQRRNELVCCVNERNLPMLQLLKSFGFMVYATERSDLGPFQDDLMIEMRFVLDRDEMVNEDEACEGRR